MLLYATTLLASWFAHPTHGVNALQASVPRVGSDPVPPPITLVTQYRDAETARQLAPLTGLPVLQLTGGNQPPFRRNPSVQPNPTDLMVEVGLRYRARADIAPDQALREAEYTMLAMERSITRLFVHPDGEAARHQHVTAYAQQWITAESTRWETAYVSDNDTVVAAMCALVLYGRNITVQT
jgi:hypothetical protein